MISNIISFSGKQPVYSRCTQIKNAKAAQIAAVIDEAYDISDKYLGVGNTKPPYPINGKTLKAKNPGCFDREGMLTSKGMSAFNEVNRDLGISYNDTMGDYLDSIVGYRCEFHEGNPNRRFDTFV